MGLTNGTSVQAQADFDGIMLLAAAELERWVRDARLEPHTFTHAWERWEAAEARREAIADFERAKHEPDRCLWLNIASLASGLEEVDILDRLLLQANQPWDIQKGSAA